MMTKREYLATVSERISCEADEVAEWGAYVGSMRLLEASWAYFERMAEVYRVNAPTAALYIQECRPGAEGLRQAVEATGFKRRVIG
jgi:hypothetical protein